jgi:hypothetical protein
MKRSKQDTRQETNTQERAPAPRAGNKVRTRVRAGAMDDWEAPVV